MESVAVDMEEGEGAESLCIHSKEAVEVGEGPVITVMWVG